MQRRISAAGRPTGTDGSDFSFRMVVDDRYKRVAEDKSRLALLILLQSVAILLLGGFKVFLSRQEKDGPKLLDLSVFFLGVFSLVIGESGRKRSRANFLRIFIAISSATLLLSIALLTEHYRWLEVLKDFTHWETSKLEFFSISAILLGSILQILVVSTTLSLIHNMKPPKKAR